MHPPELIEVGHPGHQTRQAGHERKHISWAAHVQRLVQQLGRAKLRHPVAPKYHEVHRMTHIRAKHGARTGELIEQGGWLGTHILQLERQLASTELHLTNHFTQHQWRVGPADTGQLALGLIGQRHACPVYRQKQKKRLARRLRGVGHARRACERGLTRAHCRHGSGTQVRVRRYVQSDVIGIQRLG